MRKVLIGFGAVISVLFVAQATSAMATVHFDISGPTPSSSASFDLAKMPVVSSSTSSSFTLDDVLTNAFSTVSGPYQFVTDYTFYLNDGSFYSGGYNSGERGRFYGDQLFDGPTSAPTFKSGDFNSYQANGSFFAQYSIRITEVDSPGGVPEPASWAMMLAGFGAIGSAMRRRERASISYG